MKYLEKYSDIVRPFKVFNKYGPFKGYSDHEQSKAEVINIFKELAYSGAETVITDDGIVVKGDKDDFYELDIINNKIVFPHGSETFLNDKEAKEMFHEIVKITSANSGKND